MFGQIFQAHFAKERVFIVRFAKGRVFKVRFVVWTIFFGAILSLLNLCHYCKVFTPEGRRGEKAELGEGRGTCF